MQWMIRGPFIRWLAVVAWIAVIYTTIPFVRSLRKYFVARWPSELIGIGVILIVVALCAAGLVLLRRRRPRLPVADAAWLIAIAAVLVIWTWRLMGQPEETVHFLEYGVLGVLLFRALRIHISDSSIFVAGALIGILVGIVDEIIQWFVPGRYWDYRDIVLNGGASILIQIAISRLAPAPSVPISRESWRRLCRLAAAVVMLLALCLAATPQRVNRLAEFVPALEELGTLDEAMAEYGYFHRVDEFTSFRSRLSRDDLAREDGSRAAEVAAMLDASEHAYRDFLHRTSPAIDPFAYEARVHLFARDRSAAQARKLPPDSPAYRELMTTAYRENLILERVFGATLAHSSYLWPPRRRAAIESAEDDRTIFISKAGSHLITAVSESTLRTIIVVILIALVICDLLLSRRPQSRHRSRPE
jgi:hypothetical protein